MCNWKRLTASRVEVSASDGGNNAAAASFHWAKPAINTVLASVALTPACRRRNSLISRTGRRLCGWPSVDSGLGKSVTDLISQTGRTLPDASTADGNPSWCSVEVGKDKSLHKTDWGWWRAGCSLFAMRWWKNSSSTLRHGRFKNNKGSLRQAQGLVETPQGS